MANVYIGTATYASGVQAPAIGEAVTAESVGIGFSDLADRTAANNATGSLLVTSASFLNTKFVASSSLLHTSASNIVDRIAAAEKFFYKTALTNFQSGSLPSKETCHIYSIAFDPSKNGNYTFVGQFAGASSTNPAILKTTDGGTSWTTVTPGTPSSGYSLADIEIISGVGHVVVGARNTVFHSSDGGSTYVSSSAQLPDTSGSSLVFRDIAYDSANDDMLIVGDSGWIMKTESSIIGYSASGSFYRNTPAGAGTNSFSGACITADGTWIICGNNRDIQYRSSAASSWTASNVASIPSVYYYAIETHNSTTIAVGNQGTIVRSTNNGVGWTNVSPSTTDLLVTSQAYFGVDYITSVQMWVAVGQYGFVSISDDDGLTWSHYNVPRVNTKNNSNTLYTVAGNSFNDDLIVGGLESCFYRSKIW